MAQPFIPPCKLADRFLSVRKAQVYQEQGMAPEPAIKKIVQDPEWPTFRDWLIQKRQELKGPTWFPPEIIKQIGGLQARGLEPWISSGETWEQKETRRNKGSEADFWKWFESPEGKKRIKEIAEEMHELRDPNLTSLELPYKEPIMQAVGKLIDVPAALKEKAEVEANMQKRKLDQKNSKAPEDDDGKI